MKIDGHLSKLEKDYNEFMLQYNKQNVEEILIQRAVKTTIQILYDKGLIDSYANAGKDLEDFLFTTRRRGDLSEDNTYLLSYEYLYLGYTYKNKGTDMYIYTYNYRSV